LANRVGRQGFRVGTDYPRVAEQLQVSPIDQKVNRNHDQHAEDDRPRHVPPRIANLPAHHLDVTLDEAAGAITLTGAVDETRFLCHALRMTTSLTLHADRHRVSWTDSVKNISDRPATMQMLYHVNFGPPLLGPGAELVAAIEELAPRDAAAVADVPLSDQERSQAQQAWAAKQCIRSAEQLQAHLTAQALSEADAIWQAELPLRISRHCEEHFVHRAEQRFLARKNQLDQVIYSLLRVEDASLARELYLRIAEGEADFSELAATYARGPEKTTRGIVGPVPLLQAHPTLAERLRTSRPGDLQPPLQIEQWWLVLRLESLHPASFDEEMRRRMAHELFEEWVEEEVRRRLAARTSAAPTVTAAATATTHTP
jgi:hypothetical protein